MNTRLSAPGPRLDRDRLLGVTHRALSVPPRHPWITRPEPRGRLVARFVLPLELCPTSNEGVRHRAGWQLAKHRKDVLGALKSQVYALRDCLPAFGLRVLTWPVGVFAAPLPGRPQVLAVRFSARAPDAGADWAKTPIDCLTVRHRGVGLIQDDSPYRCDQRQWWEPTPRGERGGWCVVSVWTGEEVQHG